MELATGEQISLMFSITNLAWTSRLDRYTVVPRQGTVPPMASAQETLASAMAVQRSGHVRTNPQRSMPTRAAAACLPWQGGCRLLRVTMERRHLHGLPAARGTRRQARSYVRPSLCLTARSRGTNLITRHTETRRPVECAGFFFFEGERRFLTPLAD